jgi:hypothetical protein
LHGSSRRLGIEEQRHRLADHLADNPSVKAQSDTATRNAYRLAVAGAERETGLARATFPPTGPHGGEQVIGADFWPE